MDKVNQLNVKKDMKVSELIEQFNQSGVLGSGRVARASNILCDMINDEEMNVSFELVPVRKLNSGNPTDETTLPEEIKPVRTTSNEIAEDDSTAANGTDNGTSNRENSVGNGNTGNDTVDQESPFGDSELKETQDGRISTDENGHAELQMVIPANIDNFEKYGDGYILKEDASFTPYGWAVNGACNRRADWTDIITREKSGESIGIHITYQMKVIGAV